MPDHPNPNFRAAASSIAMGASALMIWSGGGGTLAGLYLALFGPTIQYNLMGGMLILSCALALAHGLLIARGAKDVVRETNSSTAAKVLGIGFGIAAIWTVGEQLIIPLIGYYIPYSLGISPYTALIAQQSSIAFAAEAVYWTDKLLLQKFYRPRY
jgi:hypothetical protein